MSNPARTYSEAEKWRNIAHEYDASLSEAKYLLREVRAEALLPADLVSWIDSFIERHS